MRDISGKHEGDQDGEMYSACIRAVKSISPARQKQEDVAAQSVLLGDLGFDLCFALVAGVEDVEVVDLGLGHRAVAHDGDGSDHHLVIRPQTGRSDLSRHVVEWDWGLHGWRRSFGF
jgi:hypothetical protein